MPFVDIDTHHPQKLHFHTSVSIKAKSSSTWVISSSLCEGPIFYIYVESVNLFPSISSKHLSCCDPIIYVCWYIQALPFVFPCVAQCFYLNEYTVESATIIKRLRWLSMLFLQYKPCYKGSARKISTLLIVLWPRTKVRHHQFWFLLCTFISDSLLIAS